MCHRRVISSLLTLISSATVGQTVNPSYVPLPDPGYRLYFHDSDAAPNIAARWGYHDGWSDGRHDRNLGQTLKAEDKVRYLTPAVHGVQPDSALENYKQKYRAAYTRGYEHGSRL